MQPLADKDMSLNPGLETNSTKPEVSQPNRIMFILQVLTIARIPLAVIFTLTLLFWTDRKLPALLLLGSILGVLELSDVFDGVIARKYGLVTEWGKIMDPYADSISRLIVYWALAASTLVFPVVPLVMAVRDVTVAYCRILLSKHGRSVAAKSSGKIKAICQGVGSILIVLQPAYWQWLGWTRTWTVPFFSWVIILVTLGSAVEYAKTALAVSSRPE
ncbi:MAG: CDP-alcohol phosphatidyltransferase family protein [bacterium]|jgi:CDP-diacylglycerol--glycerol-3-phosphate 3-phosphatidyltransferase|nr:CDP-alcohol phosphatidyltransferase family protein [bacterium]